MIFALYFFLEILGECKERNPLLDLNLLHSQKFFLDSHMYLFALGQVVEGGQGHFKSEYLNLSSFNLSIVASKMLGWARKFGLSSCGGGKVSDWVLEVEEKCRIEVCSRPKVFTHRHCLERAAAMSCLLGKDLTSFKHFVNPICQLVASILFVFSWFVTFC